MEPALAEGQGKSVGQVSGTCCGYRGIYLVSPDLPSWGGIIPVSGGPDALGQMAAPAHIP